MTNNVEQIFIDYANENIMNQCEKEGYNDVVAQSGVHAGKCKVFVIFFIKNINKYISIN